MLAVGQFGAMFQRILDHFQRGQASELNPNFCAGLILI